jgi:hypothetical protein
VSVAIERGDGVGIEFTRELLRGVRLGRGNAGVMAAAEVPLRRLDDDRSILDAFVRLRAELGNPNVPARIATFPNGSSMRRLDVTSRTGPELNAMRAEVEERYGVISTVLVDDGPRRWMHVLHWDSSRLRPLEDLAERAGFLDVTFDPSPIALARVVPASIAFASRSAATGESWVVAFEHGVAVAAASVESVGRPHPSLVVGRDEYAVAMFDDLVAPAEVIEALATIEEGQDQDDDIDLHLAHHPYPRFPPHDLRAPERQCVALGAAVGAAGLAGRLRPVDIVTGHLPVEVRGRPWVIERVSSLPPPAVPTRPGPIRRFFARLLPRKR